MNKNIKVVIGANFGDEGKGLTTDYFASKMQGSIANVRFNGTSQAGHTVVHNGKRHVFSHIGAGSFNPNVDTIFTKHFYCNPMMLNSEIEQFEKLTGIKPKFYVHREGAMVSLYDVLYNRHIESLRGGKRHGSCGLGLWEAVKRNQTAEFTTKIKDIENITDYDISKKLIFIRDIYYLNKSKAETGNVNLFCGEEVDGVDFCENRLIDMYVNDLKKFFENVIIYDDTDRLLENYNNIIFEGSQGLLLDYDNESYMPHLTASKTNSHNVLDIISKNKDLLKYDIEFCYITRSYLTRHGAGRMDNEVLSKEVLGITENDKTNFKNEWQGSFRYGYIDIPTFINTIYKDINSIDKAINKEDYTISCMVTHLDETNGVLKTSQDDTSLNVFRNMLFLNKYYTSYGETKETIREVNF